MSRYMGLLDAEAEAEVIELKLRFKIAGLGV
jgi:hypothetical protein